VGKQHFDLLTSVARAHVRRCRCDSPSHIARGFMDAAGDLAERSVRAALGFHRTGNAVGLPESEDDGVGFGDVRTFVLEGSSLAAQYVAGWTAVFLGLFFRWKSLLEKLSFLRSVLSHSAACGSMSFSSTIPASIGAAVSCIANKAFRLDVELSFDPIDHDLCALDLRRAMSRCGFHIHNDVVLGMGQIIRGLGIKRWATWSCGPAGLKIRRFGSDSAKASSSSASRYLRTARVLGAGSFQLTCSLPGTPRCRLASALMMLASTAKPSPLTRPASMQRRSTSLNSQRTDRCPENRRVYFWKRSSDWGLHLRGLTGRTSDTPGSNGLLRTADALSECRSNSPRSACGSSTQGQLKDAQLGCKNRRGNGASRSDRDTDQCYADVDWRGCGLQG